MDVATKTYITEVKTELLEKIDEMTNSVIMWAVGVGFSILVGNTLIMIALIRLIS